MSEEQMVALVQRALAARGIEDEVVAVGQFNPRGHSGGSADALSQLCQRHGVGTRREAKLPGLIVRRAPHRLGHV